eukprot:scaffold63_cov306-Pinguiococcus_pyrenoidosus.AAC.4
MTQDFPEKNRKLHEKHWTRSTRRHRTVIQATGLAAPGPVCYVASRHSPSLDVRSVTTGTF